MVLIVSGAVVLELASERYVSLLVQIRAQCQCRCVVTQQAAKTDTCLAARCAAVASIGAAAIHFAVAPMHWNDWLPSGVFFASIAAFQLVWGLLAWSRQTSLLLAAGVAANIGSTALWAMSRTAGAPFGPNAGEPETVEAAGLCVLLLQCYVIMGAAWALLRRYRADEVSGFGRAFVLLGATTVTAGAVTVGLASGLQGHHDHHGGPAESEAEQVSVHDAHRLGRDHREAPSAPVTDMGLSTDGDRHSESLTPTDGGGHQHSHDD